VSGFLRGRPNSRANADALGALRVLEAIRVLGLRDSARFYQASTSELYGLVQQVPQSETTPFYPRSPYGVAKLYAYWITVNYREAYGLYACNGILFNHESPIRGETFVTRKITRALARIHLGLQDCLYLGNLSALRDWGARARLRRGHVAHAAATRAGGFRDRDRQSNTALRQFVDAAARELGMQLRWVGQGEDEHALDERGRRVVAVDPRYYRRAEVQTLLGDGSKARSKLGWAPATSSSNWWSRWCARI